MKEISTIGRNANLQRLIEVQKLLDRATEIFDCVFENAGAPRDTIPVCDAFYDAITEADKCIERLMGTVVYFHLFPTEEVRAKDSSITPL